MDSMIKISMDVAMEKGRQSHCLSLKTMEIVLEALPRLSGQVVSNIALEEDCLAQAHLFLVIRNYGIFVQRSS